MEKKDDKLQKAISKIQLLNEQKRAIEKELEEIDLRIKQILSKDKLMAYDPLKNIYLLNVNYRA